MLFLLGLLFAYFLPGGLLSQLLLKRFHISFAFLTSILILTLTLTGLCILRLPVTLPIVASILTAISLLLTAALIHRKISFPLSNPNPEPRTPKPEIRVAVFIRTLRLLTTRPLLLTLSLSTLFITAIFIYKQILTPIPGYDISIRWEYLALRIFQQGNASFYPPVTDDHFALYALPDAMGLAVASGYWWPYALAGKSSASLCVPLVILQFLMILHAGWSLAKTLSVSLTARCLAVFLLAVTGVITTGALIGQEVGLLTLAGLLLLSFIIQFRKHPSFPLAIAIALTCATAALTREYGGGYLLLALLFTSWPRSSRMPRVGFLSDPSLPTPTDNKRPKYFLFPLTITLIFSLAVAPWLFHVWRLTGNPFYSIGLLGLFPKNPDLWAKLMSHASRLALANIPVWFTTRQPYACLLQSLPGLLGLLALWKLKSSHSRATASGRGAILLAFALMMFTFFIWGYFPSLGDLYYAYRVAVPGIAVLTVALALWASTLHLHRRASPLRPLAFILIAILTLHASLTLLVRYDYPWRPPSQWPTLAFTPGLSGDKVAGYPNQARTFVEENLPIFQNRTILSSDAYLQRALDGLPVRVLPAWAPGTAIVMDPSLTPLTVRRLLLEKNIGFVIVNPAAPVEGTWEINSPWFTADAPNLNPRAPLAPDIEIRALPPAP